MAQTDVVRCQVQFRALGQARLPRDPRRFAPRLPIQLARTPSPSALASPPRLLVSPVGAEPCLDLAISSAMVWSPDRHCVVVVVGRRRPRSTTTPPS